MQKKRTVLGASLIGLVALGSVAVQGAAQADLAPQPKDIVTVGSDIQQNAFNFLADGYGSLPGYNTAGNKWRFINFDSSGDANGRTAYVDPSTFVNYTGDLDANGSSEKYVKVGDVKVLNPTISLAAGAPNEVRPSGGNGGITALLQDFGNHWVDVARSPNLPTAAQGATALSNLGSAIHTVQVGIDKDLIAAATVTNAPASLTLKQVAWIYRGSDGSGNPILKWKDLNAAWADETIQPLIIPTSAGMRDVFLRPIAAYWGQPYGTAAERTAFTNGYVTNPNLKTVQQNDPTVITSLADPVIKRNAIVPFPRGRFRLLENSYYIDPTVNGTAGANSYTAQGRTPLSIAGLQLLNEDGANATGADDPFAVDFPYNAIFRESDYQSETPWQPGSTLNWVQALFYNPGGPKPFVDTEAGKALLSAAGITPAYVDKGFPAAG